MKSFIKSIFLFSSIYGITSASSNTGSPKIQPFQFAKNVKSGEKASVFCLVISSSKSLKFQWLKDGKEVHQNSQIRINDGADFSAIIVDYVNFNSTGNYTCIARNEIGADSFSAFLQVEVSPSWLQEPHDVTVNVGKSIVLNCQASGYPAPKITWKKINEKAENEKIPNLEGKNSSLIISSVSINDSGMYECEAGNGVSPDIKKNILVTVIVRFIPDTRRCNSVFENIAYVCHLL